MTVRALMAPQPLPGRPRARGAARGDRALGRAQHLAGAPVVEALDVDEKDGRPVLGWKLREGLGESRAIGDRLCEIGSGVRWLGRLVKRNGDEAPEALELVEAGVVDDPVEPGAERRLAPEARQRPERLHVRLLERVVHQIAVAEQAIGESPQAVVVVAEQRKESGA